MSKTPASAEAKLSTAVVAEAAAWLAVLHGPTRSNDLEREFSRWLQSNADHPRAFEEVTEVWDDSRNVRRPARTAAGRHFPWLGVASAALVLIAVGSALWFGMRHDSIGTAIGEQRTLSLEDGTQIVLNTATRVRVSYDAYTRVVELKSGEALFEVAQRPGWPFIVIAGEQRIRALGTSFVVRHEQDRLAVTLVRGKVAVSKAAPSPGDGKEIAGVGPSAQALILAPGQRLRFDPGGTLQLDSPDINVVLAWQTRELMLDDVPLPEAIAEVNRYSVKPVILEHPQAGALRVSGLFRTGDALSFARAVAIAYRLKLIEQSDCILLRGAPRVPAIAGDGS